MGNSQSQPQNTVFLEHKLDGNYGEIMIYLNKQNMKQHADLKIVVPQEVDEQSLEKMLKTRSQLNHNCLVSILRYKNSSVDDLCSSFNVITISVEYIPVTLLDDFFNRKQHRTTYTEMELLYLLYESVDFMHYMLEQGFEIQDIHPSRILIDEQRRIRIFDRALEKDCLSNYFRVLFGMRDLEYLAPEQLLLLTQEKRSDSANQEFVNVFCLGLMVVSLISGVRCNEFYNSENYTFKEEYTLKLLEKSVSKYNYSVFLKDLVKRMLNMFNTQRPNYAELLQELIEQKDNFAQNLNPPGLQPVRFESQIVLNNTIRSHSQSMQLPQFVDFSEIDQIIKQSRQRAQISIDEAELQLKCSDYPAKDFEIIEGDYII